MNKIAVLFPGQGTQCLGMGKDFYEQCAESREVFDQAEDIRDLCWNGPEEQLNRTPYSQPALLVTEIAMWRAFQAHIGSSLQVYAVAGSSLGEFPALVAANMLSFSQALALVRKRGQWMEEACPQGCGMLAVMGLDHETLKALAEPIAAAQQGVVELVNFNAPGQIVAAGHLSALEILAQQVREHKGRAVPLKVSGPFHSSLLAGVEDKLRGELTGANFPQPIGDSPSGIRVLSNATGSYYGGDTSSIELIARQVRCPVLWEQSMRRLLADGVDLFIELGPGTVLTGLLKKIDRKINAVALNSYAKLQAFAETLSVRPNTFSS